MVVSMTALPVDDCDPDDPVEILRGLPARFHEQFLAEYDAAVADARRPEQYRQLHQLLRLWRRRADARYAPGYGGSARSRSPIRVMRPGTRLSRTRCARADEGHRSSRSSRTGTSGSRPPGAAARGGGGPGGGR